ncbi:Multidrug resistance protein 1, partial [Trichoplax sp. H2]
MQRSVSREGVDLEAANHDQGTDSSKDHNQVDFIAAKPRKKWFQKSKKEDEVIEKSVPYFQLFRYASSVDKFLMVIGSIFGIANGASMPLMMLIFGDLTDSFISFTQSGPAAINISAISGCSNVSLVNTATNTSITAVNTSIASQGLEDSVHRFMIYFIILACAVLVVSYLQISSWVIVSERQTYQIRVNFFKSIMRQDIGWFDTHKSGELITRLSDDINKIHDGIGDKAATYCQWMAACIAGFTMGFVRGWKLTLVIIAISPLLAIVAAFMSKFGSAFTNKELEAYSKAGGVAEEILSSVRTVVSFGGEKKACERYDGQLDHALRVGIKKSFVVGIGIALTFLVMFGSYALAFWYGSTLIAAGEMSGGTILTV